MSVPSVGLFAKCCCSATAVCVFCIQLTVIAVALTFGALVAWKPRKVIDLQIAAYRPFNWKIEPISMEKEIKNTRFMGLTVLGLGILALIYILVR